MLTKAEIQLCLDLGEFWNAFQDIAPSADDRTDVLNAIHVIQRTIMARSAMRAHPDEFTQK